MPGKNKTCDSWSEVSQLTVTWRWQHGRHFGGKGEGGTNGGPLLQCNRESCWKWYCCEHTYTYGNIWVCTHTNIYLVILQIPYQTEQSKLYFRSYKLIWEREFTITFRNVSWPENDDSSNITLGNPR